MNPYMQVANFDPSAIMAAQQTYVQTGMHGVTPPEALIAGEAVARGANQLAGMGDTVTPSIWKGVMVGLVGFAGGFAGGFFLSRWIYNETEERGAEE